ncbi:hypothetical protein SORBI_3001G418300 [Sorghum bicolor]|uniref:Uncharacterized protein n=1 Tax=Sorghum bicolor TaxID=4558 RepID=C5WPD0_SORBI|nr:hypothetical protein SORBI_3001G418300 [Sorghum bicolor]
MQGPPWINRRETLDGPCRPGVGHAETTGSGSRIQQHRELGRIRAWWSVVDVAVIAGKEKREVTGLRADLRFRLEDEGSPVVTGQSSAESKTSSVFLLDFPPPCLNATPRAGAAQDDSRGAQVRRRRPTHLIWSRWFAVTCVRTSTSTSARSSGEQHHAAHTAMEQGREKHRRALLRSSPRRFGEDLSAWSTTVVERSSGIQDVECGWRQREGAGENPVLLRKRSK